MVMHPMEGENGQIIRTKRWLYEALGDLLSERPFADITVGHICKRADVSRAVFYNHYNNKEELLKEIFTRIMMVYWAKVHIAVDNTGRYRSRMAYTILCKELWRSRPYFRQLNKNNYGYMLVDFFIQAHAAGFCMACNKMPPETPDYQKYFIPYHAHALAAVLFQWLDEEDPLPPERMADIVIRLFRSANVDAFINPPSARRGGVEAAAAV